METLTEKVHRILATQSPGYLISPVAAAFMVEDLDSQDVVQALGELESMGHAREDQIVLTRPQPKLDDEGNPIEGEFATDPISDEVILEDVLGENGEPIILNEGWCITDSGLQAYKNR